MAGAGDPEPPVEWSADTADDQGAPDGAGSDEELIVGGGPQRAALLLQRIGERISGVPLTSRLGLAALVGAVSGALLLGSGLLGGTTHHRPTNSGDTVSRSHSQPSVTRPQLAQSLIIAKALNATPLVDYTRSTAQPGACPVVPPKTSPTRALAVATRRALPGFRLRDVGRTLDQSTGLCALDLRAGNGRGSALIIEVVPPTRATNHPFAVTNIEVASDGSTASSILSTNTRGGWSITVAVVGPIADQPSSSAMLALTEDSSLRW